MKSKGHFRLSKILKLAGILTGLLIIILAAIGVMLQTSPSIGAYGAEYLRQIVGEQPVALMEMAVFTIQDAITKTEVNLGLDKPANPWQTSVAGKVKIYPGLAVQTQPKPITGSSGGTLITEVPANPLQPGPTQAAGWTPPAVTPLGTLAGVGSWTPYISVPSGEVVAYRTLLQPDPTRSYALTAVVTFNLKDVQLHYRIGFNDPYEPGIKKFSDGKIPAIYLSLNVLLAAFNGGFKFEHGAFGSMQDNKTSVPPRNGFGTVAFYQDGHIQIGKWGTDLSLSPDMVAFRQNGPLVIQDGAITPQVDTPNYWGYTITGSTVTWRSGIGIDQPGDTLYYFAGPYLTINSLAQAMAAVHVWDAIQLDINNFWVNFESFTSTGDQLTPEPLFPKEMNAATSRFLAPYVRDFFYVTTVTP